MTKREEGPARTRPTRADSRKPQTSAARRRMSTARKKGHVKDEAAFAQLLADRDVAWTSLSSSTPVGRWRPTGTVGSRIGDGLTLSLGVDREI